MYPEIASSTPPTCSTRLLLSEVLDQYFREADRDVVATGRYRCPYYSWGSGPALVFIPGLCDDALSFVLPIARLKDRFRCIAFDLPSGREDGARLGRYRHGDHVADLLALLDHLSMDQAYLFGSSFGSTIALAALGREPDRFPRAILQGGFAHRPLASAEVMLASWGRYWPGNMAHLPFRSTLLKFGHEAPFVDREPAVWNFFMQRGGSAPMAAVALRPASASPRSSTAAAQDSYASAHDLRRSRPVGRQKMRARVARGLAARARAELENCGHLPQYSHPEVLTEVVTRFLMPGNATC